MEGIILHIRNYGYRGSSNHGISHKQTEPSTTILRSEAESASSTRLGARLAAGPLVSCARP